MTRSSSSSLTFGQHFFMDSKILSLLEFKFNFISNLIFYKYKFGAYKNVTTKNNGNVTTTTTTTTTTWYGITGHVYSGQAQIGMCALTRTLERLELIDYTHFTYHDHLTFMTLKPKGLQSHKLNYSLQPFDHWCWTAIFVSLLALSGIIIILINIISGIIMKTKKMDYYSDNFFFIQLVVEVVVLVG